MTRMVARSALAVLILAGISMIATAAQHPPKLPPASVDWAKIYQPPVKPGEKGKRRQISLIITSASGFNAEMSRLHTNGWRVVPGTTQLAVREPSSVYARDEDIVIAVTLEREETR